MWEGRSTPAAEGGSQVDVLIGGARVSADDAVFVELLDNSVVNARAAYRRALATGEILYRDLLSLARTAHIPHPLFFAAPDVVHAQVQMKTEKLLQGVSPDTFTVNTRSMVKLRDVELIVKDLLRKQQFARDHDPTLTRNKVLGVLRRPRPTVQEDAAVLAETLGWTPGMLTATRTKDAALRALVDRIEANQILVSQSVRGVMPQLLTVKFSGMTVRDTRVPFIFLAGGDHGDAQEPTGRQIFTLTLMTVLIARGIFAPVTYDALSTAPDSRYEYDIAGELLMPTADINGLPLDALGEVRAAADMFKVTPSALTVRAMRAGLIPRDVALDWLEVLSAEFRSRPKPRPRSPKPVTAIRKYSGRSLTTRMLRAVDENRLSAREFCRVVGLNIIDPTGIPELRAALR
ncbi:ImmA/IrrE family metallo-endopeptidase [Microbacterium phyllosphaerae]|uniref:ImmA/IrrE family metallo-endopeptidase n=1 Tax=Microbacterium phyllosphaerae TaxID=124798 RepID=UPI003D658FD4